LRLARRNLDHYVTKLENKESFALARYGDGEWLTILGYYGRKNSNGCTFTEELSRDLIRIVRKEYSYDYAILRVAFRRLKYEIETWVTDQNIQINWILGDFLLGASLDGKMYPLIEQLQKRKIFYIGPEHCKNLHGDFFYIEHFLGVPKINAHASKEVLESLMFDVVDSRDIDFIGISSGLAAKVFIGDLWEYTDGEIPIIDFGSLWDGYYNVMSRSYIRKGRIDFDRVRLMNTTGVMQ